MMRGLLLALCVAAPNAMAVESGRKTTGEFLLDCKKDVRLSEGEIPKSTADLVDAITCRSYIHGVRDALSVQYVGHGSAVLCVPQEVTWTQLARVFVKWAEANPERHHEDAFNGVLVSLSAAFSCPGN